MPNQIPDYMTFDGEPVTFAEGDDEKVRTFEMTAYTGAPVDAFFGQLIVDLAGMTLGGTKRRPTLRDHDSRNIAGFSTSLEKSESELKAGGRLSNNTPAGREVAALADEGFPWQASIGFSIAKAVFIDDDEPVTINGRELKGPLTVIRQSRLREVSFVANGADPETSVAVFSADNDAKMIPVENSERNDTMSGKSETDPVAEFESEHADTVDTWKAEAAHEANESNAKRLAALTAKFGDNPKFVLDQFTAGHTVEEAAVEYADIAKTELAARDKTIAELKAKQPSGDGQAALSLADGEEEAAPEPDGAKEPKARAEWEFDNDKTTYTSRNRDSYVGIRTAELSGRHTTKSA